MANIQDAISGKMAKVSDAGSVLVTFGDDGYPTFFTKIYHPRLTSNIAAGNLLWALRAPADRTVIFRGGQIKIDMDVTLSTMAEVGATLVRFQGADPGGGTVLVATRMKTTDADAKTLVIKSATASSPLTSVGLTLEPVTQGFFHVTVPGTAGSQASIDLTSWSGLELAPGEGVALVAGSAVPIGFKSSGWLQFSEMA